MSEVLDLWRGALLTAALVSTPFLLATLIVGLVVSLIQAATQLQEAALSFVPKLLAAGLVMALLGTWALDEMTRYARSAITSLGEPHEAEVQR